MPLVIAVYDVMLWLLTAGRRAFCYTADIVMNHGDDDDYEIVLLNFTSLLVNSRYHHHTTTTTAATTTITTHWELNPYPSSIPGAGHLSRYVTSHPGQLSLAIPSWVGAMSTSQRAVMPCVWGVKAGTVRVWVACKTV